MFGWNWCILDTVEVKAQMVVRELDDGVELVIGEKASQCGGRRIRGEWKGEDMKGNRVRVVGCPASDACKGLPLVSRKRHIEKLHKELKRIVLQCRL